MQNGDVISGKQAHVVAVGDDGNIQTLIKTIRGVQVVLDRDVARLVVWCCDWSIEQASQAQRRTIPRGFYVQAVR